MDSDTTAPQDRTEIAAIKQIIATAEHAQNNELPDEFLSLFRGDAIWTTGGGKRLYGLEEIAEFTRQMLPGGMEGMKVTFEVEHLMFIRPDVAAVKLRQVYETQDGVDRRLAALGDGQGGRAVAAGGLPEHGCAR